MVVPVDEYHNIFILPPIRWICKNKLYLNRVAIGEFISNSYGLYWSSSEIQSYPYHSAWLQDFSNGGPLSIFKSFDFDVNVRAIRSF